MLRSLIPPFFAEIRRSRAALAMPLAALALAAALPVYPARAQAPAAPAQVTDGGVYAPAPPRPAPAGAVTGDWMVRNLAGEPGTLNPLLATDVYEGMVNGGIFEGLIGQNPLTQKYERGLAESWEVSEDKLTFTFRLNKNAKWSDGKPVTAADVIFTFDRLKDPKTEAPHLQVYYIDLEKWEALDDHTVRFKASKPYFKFFDMIGGVGILPKHIYGDGDFNKHPAGRSPVGSGPYTFEKWDTGNAITIKRNPGYWDAANKPVFPDRIVLRKLVDDTVTMTQLKSGNIDLYEAILPLQWKREIDKPENDKRFHKLAYDFPAYSYMGFNLRRPQFADLKVRKALDLLIDRNKIIERVYLGYATPVSGPFYIKSGSYNHDVKPTAFDPEAAKQLLAEAGWVDTDGDGVLDKDGKPFTFSLMIIAGRQIHEQISQIVQQDLARAGIKLEIRKLEWAAALQHIDEWQFDSMLMGWALDMKSDPYQLWHSSGADKKGSSNNLGYKNAEVDKLIEEGRVEYDDAKREAMYKKIHAIISSEVPCAFLVAPKGLTAADIRWQGIETFGPRPCFDISRWFVPTDKQKHKN